MGKLLKCFYLTSPFIELDPSPSLPSNASGTAQVNLNTAQCAVSSNPLMFTLEAAQQGASFLLVESDGKHLATVTSLKQ